MGKSPRRGVGCGGMGEEESRDKRCRSMHERGLAHARVHHMEWRKEGPICRLRCHIIRSWYQSSGCTTLATVPSQTKMLKGGKSWLKPKPVSDYCNIKARVSTHSVYNLFTTAPKLRFTHAKFAQHHSGRRNWTRADYVSVK